MGGVKSQKTSCQMSVEKVARTRSLPSDGSTLWMLARNARRGRRDGQAKDHGYAHQLLQICMSMEVQTRFFSDQEDSFPISDQWSGTVRMRTNVLLFIIASAAHGHLLCAVLGGSTTSLNQRHQSPRVPGT